MGNSLVTCLNVVGQAKRNCKEPFFTFHFLIVESIPLKYPVAPVVVLVFDPFVVVIAALVVLFDLVAVVQFAVSIVQFVLAFFAVVVAALTVVDYLLILRPLDR